VPPSDHYTARLVLDRTRANAHFEGIMFHARIAMAAAALFLLAAATPSAQAACELKSADGRIKRVVYECSLLAGRSAPCAGLGDCVDMEGDP
jgi:hypothetical protein